MYEFISPMRTKFSAHLVLIYVITFIIFGEEYKFFSSPLYLWNFLQPPS
jgi:hypothetical protein